MSEPGDDDFSRAVTELGDPDAVFRISSGRHQAKLWTGRGLLVVGLGASGLMLAIGAFGFAALAKFLLTPPVIGAVILYHMYRQRGLVVLVYPTGLLRLQRGAVESYPWPELAKVRLKLQRADSVEVRHDDAG